MGNPTKKKRQFQFIGILKDVWEATRRNSSYKSDFQKFKGRIKQDPVGALKVFNDKWKISPLDPSLTFEAIWERWRKGIELGYKPRPFPLEILYRKGETNFPIFSSYPSSFSDKFDITINAKCAKAEILSAIEELLEFKKGFRHIIKSKKKGRIRKMSVDPWKVYDMRKEGGMTFLKITHDLFKETGHPAYDDEVSKHYKQVKRAFQKAQSMIKSVTPER